MEETLSGKSFSLKIALPVEKKKKMQFPDKKLFYLNILPHSKEHFAAFTLGWSHLTDGFFNVASIEVNRKYTVNSSLAVTFRYYTYLSRSF